MAHRIRLVAMRDTTVDALERDIDAACQRGDSYLYGESNGWCWCLASVWTMPEDVLEKITETGQRTALQATTSDGERWYLRLVSPDTESFTICHPFVLLDSGFDEDDLEDDEEVDFDDDDDEYDEFDTIAGLDRDNKLTAFLWDEEEEARQRKEAEDEPEPHAIDDLVDDVSLFGMEVPEDLIQACRQLSSAEAAAKFFGWQADSLVNALAAANLPFDEDAVRGVFDPSNMTVLESDSDLGNLPRLCQSLGITGWIQMEDEDPEEYGDDDEFEDDLEDEEYDDEEFDDDDESLDGHSSEDCAITDDVLESVSDLPMHAIAGGPTRLSLKSAGDLYRTVWFTDSTASVVLRMRLPDGLKAPGGFGDFDYAEWSKRGSDYYLATDEAQTWLFNDEDDEAEDESSIAKPLQLLPTGTEFEMLTAGEEIDAGHQRFCGRVESGIWSIEQSSIPGLSSADLIEALELAALVNSTGPIPVRPEEQDRVNELIDRQELFDQEPMELVDGAYNCESYLRAWLVKIIFRVRFEDKDLWNVKAEDEALAEQTEEFMNALSKFIPKPVPVTGEVFYEGDRRFFKATLSVDEDWLAERESALSALGFTPIGDFACEKLPGLVVRAYAGPSDCHAHVLQGDIGTNLEFFSVFEDGSSLTTNDGSQEESYAKKGIYYRSYEDRSVEEILQKHRDGIARFAEHKQTTPVKHFAELAQVAQQLDAFMNRHPALSRM